MAESATSMDLMRLRRKPLRPSSRTEEYTQRLMRQLGLPDKATVGRLAVGRSLADPSIPPVIDDEDGSAGKEIRADTLFGDDLAIWTALVVEHAGLSDPKFDEVADLIRRHWDRGCDQLWQQWRDSDQKLSNFLQDLAGKASLPEHEPIGLAGATGNADGSASSLSTSPIMLRLGDVGMVAGTDERAEWALNRNGQSPHLGIFGKSGKGKTGLAKSLFRQLRAAGAPLLIIDPKGELREDTAFISELGAQLVTLGQDPIPLDALAGSPQSIVRIADGFVEALAHALPQLGPKQQDVAREVAKKLIATGRRVRFEDIVDSVDAHYQKNKLKTDVLTASLHKLKDYGLFRPQIAPGDFFSRSWVISVNEAQDEALRFAMLFLLDALLRYMRAASEAPVDSARQYRAVRTVLAIDEARRVMDVASPALMEGLVLECRSKGLACMLISQSPDHLDRASDDIVKQFEVIASFEADVTAKATKRLFGARFGPSDLQALERGHCLARLPGKDGAVVVRAW